MPRPTIVLLHGQPDSSASFWPLRRELADRLPAGVQILAPDRPGYGANLLPATDYAGNVRWLQGWLKQIEAGPVVLVGHSWAGGVAVLAAAEPAPSLTGLVLLASIGPRCLLPIDPVLGAPLLGELIAYSTQRLGGPLLRRRARSVILGSVAASDRDYAAASGLAMRWRPVWRSFLLEQRALLRELPEINAALAAIAVPTAVISGTEDSVIPIRTPAALLAGVADATGFQVEGAGHDLQLRQGGEVADLIAGFAGTLLEAS